MADQPLSGARVLVLEDEFLVAMSLEALLQDLGAEVVGPFATVSAGLQAAAAGKLDAAVLDVNLRDGMVTPVAEALADRGVPAVLHTACGDGALPPLLAAQPRLSKPCAEGRLREALVDLLSARRRVA